jgi:hypothetical protein
MTSQAEDFFTHGDERWVPIGVSKDERRAAAGPRASPIGTSRLFEPPMVDLYPAYRNPSVCSRGYHCVFALSGPRLVVDTFHVNLHGGKAGHAVNGVEPKVKQGMLNNSYAGVGYPLEFTGGLLLGHGVVAMFRACKAIRDLQRLLAYESLLELTFHNGALVASFDRSSQVAELRQQLMTSQPGGTPTPEQTCQRVAELLSGEYDIVTY